MQKLRTCGAGGVLAVVCMLVPLVAAQPGTAAHSGAVVEAFLNDRDGDALTAARHYLGLLERDDEAVRPLHRTYLVQAAAVLPDSLHRRLTSRRRGTDPARWSLHPRTGPLLAAWWREQDPLPATAKNERVVEHLTRLQYALSRYPDRGRPDGLDDRGRVYVRFGPSLRTHTLRFQDGRFIADVFRFGVPVTRSDFPDNALWCYPDVHPEACFLFAHTAGTFRHATPADLLPSVLRRGAGTTRRTLNHAVSTLAALRYIYAELASYHVDYADRYASVEDYALWQEEQRVRSELGVRPAPGVDGVAVGEGSQARRAFANPMTNVDPPDVFVQRTLRRIEVESHQARRRRGTVVPPSEMPIDDEMSSALPMAVRAARFLGDDGTTRTEVYWSPAPGAVDDESSRDTSDLTVYAVRLGGDYRRRHVQAARHLLVLPGASDTALPPQTTVVPGDSARDRARYHVRLQWEHRAPDGRIQRRAVHALDGLQPLDADPARLQMSDLRPVFWSAEAGIPDDPAGALPYPFAALTPRTALALVFEVYHLTYDDTDRTCTDVTYEVEHDGERLTAGSARRHHAARRARDYVVVEPQAWRDAEHVTLRIRVQDCVSQQRVARSLSFRVVDDP